MPKVKTRCSLFWMGDLTFGLDTELIDPVAIFPDMPAARTCLAGGSFGQGVSANWAAEKVVFLRHG